MSLEDEHPLNGTHEQRKGTKGSKSIHDAQTIVEIQTCLADLRVQHDEATNQLEQSISSHEDLSRQLRRLDLSRARLGSLAVTARGLSHGMLSGPALTAGRISDAVERLDLEQARVKATLEVVEQVAELKSCVLGVVGSMGAPQDWETAAEYIHRASRIPAHVIESGFAEQVVPTAEVPDSPRITLDTAAQSLCVLFLREFERAVAETDGTKITRFFKMFPLIGRSKEGLDAYGKYVCQGVAQRARARLQSGPGVNRRDGQLYTTALTKLFEHIAQVIDGHSPLVERHYGAGTMLQVMERLHREADVQGGIILDTWGDERSIDRKLTDVKSYAYSFLVQSFLPSQRALAGTPRTQSPAAGHSNNATRTQPEDTIDMKEIDRVLSEIGTMLGHWSLYLRFIASHSTVSCLSRNIYTRSNGHIQISHEQDAHGADNVALTVPPFIRNSNLPKKITKILTEPFTAFATFFLRRSVERAFQLDEVPSGLTMILSKSISANPPFITSAVDDVMYVVNQILQRALASSQADIVVAVVATIGRVLGSDFIGMIQRKMRDESYPKATVQGAPPPDDKVLAFLVLINNLDVATDYIRRIVESQLPEEHAHHSDSGSSSSRSLDDLFPMNKDARNVRNALHNLEAGFSAKASELVNDGLSVLFQQVLKPRMRPLLTDAFRETDYSVSDDEHYENRRLAALEEDGDGGSMIKARMGPAWDSLVRPAKRILTERVSDKLLSTTTSHLANLLERRIWSYYARVSEVGALALEKDIVDVANIASKAGNFKLREVFTRCIQIVTIMNLEEEEWDVVRDGNDADSEWVLNENERTRARAIVKGRE